MTPGQTPKLNISKIKKKNCLLELTKLFQELLHSNKYVVSPDEFKKIIPKQFALSKVEEDATEFIRTLLEVIE